LGKDCRNFSLAPIRGPVGNDRPALNGQLSAGKTKLIEAFIAASGEAVRE
jgi:hypothetical protein